VSFIIISVNKDGKEYSMKISSQDEAERISVEFHGGTCMSQDDQTEEPVAKPTAHKKEDAAITSGKRTRGASRKKKVTKYVNPDPVHDQHFEPVPDDQHPDDENKPIHEATAMPNTPHVHVCDERDKLADTHINECVPEVKTPRKRKKETVLSYKDKLEKEITALAELTGRGGHGLLIELTGKDNFDNVSEEEAKAVYDLRFGN